MSGWENFFIAEVGASAALAGLIFVGVSINLTRILSIPKLPDRALLALIILLTILVMSSLMLVPGQPQMLMSSEVLVIGLVSWVLVFRLDISFFRTKDDEHRRAALFNITLSQLAVLPYIITGIVILVSGSIGLYWMVPAIVFSFLKAVMDSWVLLVEINR